MLSNSNFCDNHPGVLIGGIYIGQNGLKIQRKICMECILQYKIPHEYVFSKDDFIQQLLKKSQQLNMKTQLTQSDSKAIFKNILHQLSTFQEEINIIFSNIKEFIEVIQNDEKKCDHQFLQLINPDINPYDCSNSELDFLVRFLEGKNFQQQMKNKKILFELINKAEAQINSLIDYFYKINQIIENISKKFQFHNIKSNNPEVVNKSKKEQHLEFKGQYGIKGYKIKLWKYFWKGQHIGGGSYNLIGQKDGKWIDLCKNFQENKNILEIGYYQKGTRIGEWSFNQNDQQIGGGSYDREGNLRKVGKWVELDEKFDSDKQVIYNGEYNTNNKKVGRWDIMFQGKQEKIYKQIIFKSTNIYIVVEDHMIKKEIRKRLESGQNCLKGISFKLKSLIMENII